MKKFRLYQIYRWCNSWETSKSGQKRNMLVDQKNKRQGSTQFQRYVLYIYYQYIINDWMVTNKLCVTISFKNYEKNDLIYSFEAQ